MEIRNLASLGFSKYNVTDFGMVIGPRGELVTPQGQVWMYPDNKRYRQLRRSVHLLVATMFVPNPDNKENVRFKDGNKLNTKADNLEWY